ncbi:helix-turn-helix domain-containing protein [Ralstonia insidiosa]|uniref:Helix-turn-helix domain-containing protein n=1 Tax=Ralstonia insidiosa TaxID=190721 RepID=A0A848NVB5_9RALS|nr:helix-turn-helix domain-containing protein [Ralstonia insidiosa]
MTLGLLTSEQVAEALGCEVAHVNMMAATHRLPGVKLGRSWRFPVAALARFLDEQATANLTLPVRAAQYTPPIKATKRGKPLPDLLQAMRDAGMSSEEQISLIFEAARKSKPQQ